ncbi:MAG: hypothetical protein Q4G21_02160 [Dermabacter sp.]|nr:hypothetical protein [Dermabacter sp.]
MKIVLATPEGLFVPDSPHMLLLIGGALVVACAVFLAGYFLGKYVERQRASRRNELSDS